MSGPRTETLRRLEELLPRAFYALAAIALLAALLGSTGVAWVFLLLASAVHVVRVGFEAASRG